ncbi:quinol:cytochrome C oxidoreductase [Persicobacter diffluens]|uniref:Quinol:cytochrome C oxidoreductase n=1 Tax=Persicobacter diffluens TaxID=981 RepID=A0AAN4VYQ1_9BACT|nr:quinol:cytochrome C oxidoreductase [Persicobacter diffluens]
MTETFDFSAAVKKPLIMAAIAGLVCLIIGVASGVMGGGHHEAAHDDHAPKVEHAAGHDAHAEAAHGDAHATGGHHEEFSWTKRVWTSLWHNGVFFLGIAAAGILFFAVQYAAQAGWSAPVQRIPLAMGNWLPIGGGIIIVLFTVFNHDLFHWTHDYLYEKGTPTYDAILDGKRSFLNVPFFIGRMVAYVALWTVMFFQLKKNALAEDENGGDQYWFRGRKLSAIYIILFAVTGVTASWDWLMSIDPHWFSTLYGWYVIASWWVTGLAFICMTVVLLKENGYLKEVNANHIHDLGKYVFAFSVFWTYLWFSQFLLIYYANIPEETIYFVERLQTGPYKALFFINILINFIFPFLFLMTRDSKRHGIFLKIACPAVIFGHWIDFYLMVAPGILKGNGGLTFIDLGFFLIFGVAFIWVFLTNLAKSPLVALNHPMMEEAKHHHI